MEIKELKRRGQKPVDTAVATLLWRKVSIRITKRLIKTNVTPNQITLLSLLFGTISAILFSFGIYSFSIIAAMILQLYMIFDCVDGEIAKIKSMTSRFGALLDVVSNRFVDVLVFFGIAYGLCVSTPDDIAWIVTFLALSGSFMAGFYSVMHDHLYKDESVVDEIKNKAGKYHILFLYGGDANYLLILVGAILNQMLIALILIAIASNALWIVRLLLYYNKDRRRVR